MQNSFGAEIFLIESYHDKIGIVKMEEIRWNYRNV